MTTQTHTQILKVPLSQTLTPKYVNKEVGAIYIKGRKYILVTSDLSVMIVSSKLKGVLSQIYSRITSVFFDREGNLHVRYEYPLEDVNGSLIDYVHREDIWYRVK